MQDRGFKAAGKCGKIVLIAEFKALTRSRPDMMQGYNGMGMGWGMGLSGLLILVLVVLVIAALIKYLRS